MEKTLINFAKLKKIFCRYQAIKLVYLFGSHARNQAGPLSDYDFAIYLKSKNPVSRFNLKLKLFNDLSKILKSDKIDIVILNDTEGSELKYNIIQEGKLIYEKEPFKVLIEPKILNEFFDFRETLRRYHLTRT